jgi:7-carboxy-7-deazaguanine synthase
MRSDNLDTLPVNELFETIQGEATYTGMPSTFVRLQGCEVGCPWCDTKYTWELNEANEVSLGDVLRKTASALPSFANVSVDDLVFALRSMKPRHLVITGGEPCMFDLTELSARLLNDGWTVQVETSGTELIRIDPRAWITVSPKIDMPGGRKFRADAWKRANEVKMPVGKPHDVEVLRLLIEQHGEPPVIWLQPLSMSVKATALCTEIAMANRWRISIQVHKYLGVR